MAKNPYVKNGWHDPIYGKSSRTVFFIASYRNMTVNLRSKKNYSKTKELVVEGKRKS